MWGRPEVRPVSQPMGVFSRPHVRYRAKRKHLNIAVGTLTGREAMTNSFLRYRGT